MVQWLSRTARDNYDCPRCGVKKGELCVTPQGHHLLGFPVHRARTALCTLLERMQSTIKVSPK